MKTDLNNEILKSLVTTLQGQVDALKAENKALQDYPWLDEEWNLFGESEKALPGTDPGGFSQARIDDLERERNALNTENIDLRKKYFDKETVDHNTAHLWNERDKLVEENSELRKEKHKISEKLRKISLGNFDEYFTYTTSPITLTSKGSVTTNIAITREADFYVTKIVRIQDGPFAFLVRDSSNDRQWSNIYLHSDMGAGTAQFPLILPKPRFVARAATLTVELTNLSTYANEVRLAFIGYNVYHVEALYSTAE